MKRRSSISIVFISIGTISFLTFQVNAEESSILTSSWHFGASLDAGYSLDFNYPQNHFFRSRGTASKVNEPKINMAFAYVSKDPVKQSRWGMELGGQTGEDSRNFAFSATAPNIDGAEALSHFYRANVSYLAPIGKGLTIQAGLFSSLIGYESLYARDNFNYTRAWIADNSPYHMFGINSSCQVNDRLSLALYVIHQYFHLAQANNLPSYGVQSGYKQSDKVTIKETLYYGPDQQNTLIDFWRLFSDSIVEWKSKEITVALEYQAVTEKIADQPGNPGSLWTGGALYSKWNFKGPWSAALRPEFYWDRDARMTGFRQFVKSVTSTLEYKLSYSRTNTLLRLEYRYDGSTGQDGGFFKGGEISPGVFGLTPDQHLLIAGILWSFD